MPPALSLATSPTPTRRRLEVLPIGIFLAFAVLPAAAPLAGGEHLLSLGSRVMIFAIAAVALDLLVGYGALISFGHAAFIGLGAYAVGILAAHGIGDALVSLPVALAVSALYAFLTGIVCLRTKGVYFIMITLAFGQMAFFTASSLAPYGGDDGLTIAARSTFAGFPLLIALDQLVGRGWLDQSDLEAPDFPPAQVQFEGAAAFKLERLRKALVPPIWSG